MPNGFFNFFSGKDDTPPAPEIRRMPYWAESIQSSDDRWITSQVFVDKKDKNRRIYFAARYSGHHKSWEIEKYSYSTKQSFYSTTTFFDSLTCGQAIRLLARLEQDLHKDTNKIGSRDITEILCGPPVPGLKGNYREIANLHSAYFDDQGNYVDVAKNEPVVKDATFSRKSIQALYSKAAEKPAEPTIKTWDDFYREIVHKYPPEALSRAALPDWLVKCSREMIGEAKALSLKIKDPHASLQEKLLARNCAHCRGVKVDDFMEAEYSFHVVQLAALMRAGSEVFRQLPTSISGSAENMELLKEIGETIRHFVTIQHSKNFGLSPKQAEQLVNIMMQGPDPYADKPLPLEVFFNKYKDQLSPAPQTKPKNPGL